MNTPDHVDGAWEELDDLGRPELRWGVGFTAAAVFFVPLTWLVVHWTPKAPLPSPPPPSVEMIDLAPLPAAPLTLPTVTSEVQQKLPVAPPSFVPQISVPVQSKSKPAEHHRIVVHRTLLNQTPSKAPLIQATTVASQTHPLATTNVAPNLPASATPPDAMPTWQSLLMERLEAFKRYPPEAQEAGEQGVVYLHFAIDRKGRIFSANIAKSSGFDDLDDETINLVYRAEPLPPPPSEVQGDPIVLTVPVQFFLRH